MGCEDWNWLLEDWNWSLEDWNWSLEDWNWSLEDWNWSLEDWNWSLEYWNWSLEDGWEDLMQHCFGWGFEVVVIGSYWSGLVLIGDSLEFELESAKCHS